MGLVGRLVGRVASLLVVIVLTVFTCAAVMRYVVITGSVASGSMEPTVVTGDTVLGCRMCYDYAGPARGDVAFFHPVDNQQAVYIKRIVGVPGDVVRVHDGRVFVNNVELKALPYHASSDARGDGLWQVPADSFFMLGDNRANSDDSRFWKRPFVPRGNILAKAFYVWGDSGWRKV